MTQAGGVSPLKLFGSMLAFFRERAGLTPEQPGALVHVSGSLIRKVEAGHWTASEQLVTACEAIGDLHCDGALRALFKNMRDYMKTGVFPGWFAGWPGKEAGAVRLRSFQPVVLPGLVRMPLSLGLCWSVACLAIGRGCGPRMAGIRPPPVLGALPPRWPPVGGIAAAKTRTRCRHRTAVRRPIPPTGAGSRTSNAANGWQAAITTASHRSDTSRPECSTWPVITQWLIS